MKGLKKAVLCLLLAGLTACAPKTDGLPAPVQLMEEIRAEVELPVMVDVADYMLLANTGIAPEECDGAVYYIPEEGMAPDEIIIIRAKDNAGADRAEELLRSWLAYREEAAQVYLTEYMPLIQAGVIRRDGLTVSLIVSDKANEIIRVFENYK